MEECLTHLDQLLHLLELCLGLCQGRNCGLNDPSFLSLLSEISQSEPVVRTRQHLSCASVSSPPLLPCFHSDESRKGVGMVIAA